MSAAQRTLPKIKFGFSTRPTITLCVIEETIQENRLMNPIPSRMTLIRWVESGILEGKKTPTGIWVVYQDSFENYVRKLQKRTHRRIMTALGFSLAAIFLVLWLLAKNDLKHERAANATLHKALTDVGRSLPTEH